MAKLQLDAAPTFQADVGIPVAGGEPVPVKLTFKHRTKAELEKFIKGRAEKSDVDSFLDMVTAWDLEDDFTKKNVEKLLQNYIGAALATFHAYIDQLVQARRGN
jgi:hypothetical protein